MCVVADSCETLPLVWLQQRGAVLGLNDSEVVGNKTVSECQSACLSSLSPSECSALTYPANDQVSGECRLFSQDKRQAPDSFQPSRSTFYYEWQCQNSEFTLSALRQFSLCSCPSLQGFGACRSRSVHFAITHNF